MSGNNPIQQRMRAESFRHFSRHAFGQKHFGWRTVLYTVLLILAGGWFPDSFAEFVKYIFGGDWSLWVINYRLIISISILIFFGVQLTKISESGNIEVSQEVPEPVKVLAIFLSRFNISRFGKQPTGQIVLRQELESLEQVLVENTLSNETLDGTTWEIPLAAVEFHKSHLEKLYLFTSSGKDGTSASSKLFIRIINVLYPEIYVQEFTPKGVDFDNIKPVFDAVENLYTVAIDSGYKATDVLVDATGGNKPASIAVSIATLVAGRKFQYIGGDGGVHSYEVGYFIEDKN